MQAELLYECHCSLGEGPMWHKERKSFFWVDIDGRCFYEYSLDTTTVQKRPLDFRVSLLVKYRPDKNKLLLAIQGGLALYDLASETFTWMADLEKDTPMHRTNDGACDCNGNLWIGTMHCRFENGAGSLYRIDKNFTVEKKLEGVTISNGIVWSNDNSRMYFIDTPTQTVRSFLFDAGTGNIEFEKVVVNIDESNGSPDGMSIDEEGMLWVAQWNGFGIYRYNPSDGKLLGKIIVPAPQVSSCAFGGGEMDELIITTARENFTQEQSDQYPLSGNVFIAKPGLRGVMPHEFG